MLCSIMNEKNNDLENKNLETGSIHAWSRLVRVSSKLVQQVECDIKAANAPPLAWIAVLMVMRQAEPEHLRPVDIQQKMLVKQYNISRLIDRLVKENYAERISCDCDGRGQYIVLKQKGNDLLDKEWPTYEQAINKHFSDKLSPDDVDELLKILDKL